MEQIWYLKLLFKDENVLSFLKIMVLVRYYKWNVDIEEKIKNYCYNGWKVYADVYLDDKSVIIS